MFLTRHKTTLPTPDSALPGRREALPVDGRHAVLGSPLAPPYPDGFQIAVFGLGCFWGAERKFWESAGVYSTSVGYTGGFTPNPTYDEVCSGRTGHAEVVQVVFDPNQVGYRDLLKIFWESHDPTQGMRQGNDAGTQYRSAIYYRDEGQRRAAEETRAAFQPVLERARYGGITTEIAPVADYYFAENYHQQYLAKVPNGYCGLGGTGLQLGDQQSGSCPTGVAASD